MTQIFNSRSGTEPKIVNFYYFFHSLFHSLPPFITLDFILLTLLPHSQLSCSLPCHFMVSALQSTSSRQSNAQSTEYCGGNHLSRMITATNLVTLKYRHLFVTNLEARRLKSRFWQGHIPSEVSRGESFLASFNFWWSLAFPGLQQHNSILCLSLHRVFSTSLYVFSSYEDILNSG